MHNKVHRTLLVLLILISLSITSAEVLILENNTYEMHFAIDDAYYTSLDPDGIENDIVVKFNLNHTCTTKITFYMRFTLTLTSGQFIQNEYLVKADVNQINGSMLFYDDAVENGWYNIKIEILLLSGGIDYGSINLDFDPPGTDDDEPDISNNVLLLSSD
ncbi:MAG: hypothetical protein INQ03_08205 [Candidatus Heimdallarchaeota archaeon]|nr:hypothetical protein [Candidatus Heimdallarchaeota archaeon]